MKKQRYRRKPYTCILCQEEETYDWDHVCSSCRKAWHRGADWAKAEDAAPPDGIIEATIARYWYFYHFAGDVSKYEEARKEIRAALLELVGTTEMRGLGYSRSWGIGYPKTYKGNVSLGKYALHGNEHTLELLQSIYENICHLMAHAYQEGERRGKSFITDLVEGKLTTKDLERL